MIQCFYHNRMGIVGSRWFVALMDRPVEGCGFAYQHTCNLGYMYVGLTDCFGACMFAF